MLQLPLASSGLGGRSRQGEVEGAAVWGLVSGFCTVPGIHGLSKSSGETELRAGVLLQGEVRKGGDGIQETLGCPGTLVPGHHLSHPASG